MSNAKIKCLLIRHGKTQGNLEKRYIGCKTDEPLLEIYTETLGYTGEQIERLIGKPDKVYVSPMLRCRQTAELLFAKSEYVVVDDLRETDFGDFENKNYSELCDNSDYQKWMDSNGTMPFPNGEAREDCIDRTVAAFETVIAGVYKTMTLADGDKDANATVWNQDDTNAVTNEIPSIVFVIHGGSIMAIMSSLTGRDYYDFQVGCCEGFILECTVKNGKIVDISYDSLFGRNCS